MGLKTTLRYVPRIRQVGWIIRVIPPSPQITLDIRGPPAAIRTELFSPRTSPFCALYFTTRWSFPGSPSDFLFFSFSLFLASPSLPKHCRWYGGTPQSRRRVFPQNARDPPQKQNKTTIRKQREWRISILCLCERDAAAYVLRAGRVLMLFFFISEFEISIFSSYVYFLPSGILRR